ncbi:MAG: histidine--tRNA ligase [Acidobacteria bacterium]|nr:histidine--tRNA ligase [Acidobacteriota bacterium]
MYTFDDGVPAETLIRDVWLSCHAPEIAGRLRFNERLINEPYRQGPHEIGFNAFWNGRWTVVRPRYPVTSVDIRQIELYANEWRKERQEELSELGPIAPRLLVVTAQNGLTPEIAELAKSRAIEIESLSIADFEPPQSLTLRPENTAGVVRAYIEHNLWQRGLNKLYYIGPQFRRERPQKGRYRQFYQIGAEVIGPATAGSESPARDAEILELLAALLDKLGIKDWQLQLNSIGCADDRARYNEALGIALQPVKGQMCSDCQRRAAVNPLRIFDCKVPADQPIIEQLPRITQFLDEPCRRHFDEVQKILQALGVRFELNERLVRGLDYYTRTAFEFTHGALGAQNAILGGGRYDGLSQALGGPPAPGIGFAIGEDRLVMALGKSAEEVLERPEVYIAPLGPGMNKECARLARELRGHDIVVELGDESFRLKKSLETASKLGAKYVLIAGENELSTGVFGLKNLSTGKQQAVPRDHLLHTIRGQNGL